MPLDITKDSIPIRCDPTGNRNRNVEEILEALYGLISSHKTQE